MRKFSRCHVATVWLSRDGFAPANVEYPTITQQHTTLIYYNLILLSTSRRKHIKQTSLYLLISVSIKTMGKSRHTDDSRVASQCGSRMVLRSGITTQSKGTERKRSSVSISKSKLRQHLPFLFACFKSNGKQRK